MPEIYMGGGGVEGGILGRMRYVALSQLTRGCGGVSLSDGGQTECFFERIFRNRQHAFIRQLTVHLVHLHAHDQIR